MNEGILKRSDFELTLKELKNQRTQMLIQLNIVDAGIERCYREIENMPEEEQEVVEVD